MAATTPDARANVAPLRPVRVLVASDDTRFVAAALFLLSRREFAVASARSTGVLTTLEETCCDVVVVDASESFADAARLAAAIEGRHPRTRVVFVADAAVPFAAALPKWDGLQGLGDAVVRAYATIG